MEIKEKDNEGILNTDGNRPLPRPIPVRKCKCGCGNTFYPTRKDKVYLNKQHADYAYNHGKRKEENSNRIEIEKILLNNDKVLEKHYKTKGTLEVDCYLDIIKADGFKLAYQIGVHEKENIKFYYSYNYYFYIYLANKIKMIKIFKR